MVSGAQERELREREQTRGVGTKSEEESDGGRWMDGCKWVMR